MKESQMDPNAKPSTASTGSRQDAKCPTRIVAVAVVVLLSLVLTPLVRAQDARRSLFDGKTLKGWETLQEDKSWWNVTNGTIAGGSLTRKVPHNSFLATKRSYHNFDLRLQIRISGTEGFINSGIQIRSVRKPASHEMIGYQVDAGKGWWGKLYDESRRRKVIGEAADLAAVNAAVKENGWNDYRIRAEGPRIRSWINNVPALDYTETDSNIPLDGHIGIQVHGGGKALVQVRRVTIEELPATPNAPTWKKVGLPKAPKPKAKAKRRSEKVTTQLDIRSVNRSPAEELKGFKVPEGFEVELVASESSGIGKFVAVAFDVRGRMWTMTALEYPVDANENAEVSRQLFAKGGVDKVLVYDQPFGRTPSKPRVFVEGLVMPLGILPHSDGVYVQYGNDIRFYRDTDGDGKADKHEVILTGFGTQDSHLFPHQFTRTPGGWILTAQGLFNRSIVRRPNGLAFADGAMEVTFNHTKLARFRPDGSLFEKLTAGPNNIWGLTISREGETWLQEANDVGYPIIPYEPGGYYRTGSRERLKPYQPLMPPPLSPPQMGGTGLSGLALADDRDGWPAPWGLKDASAKSPRMLYVANPIVSRIQVIRATPTSGRYHYEKLPDFLISEDARFRPVALQFGPDGCLYVVDWYNKIISHNEVPRSHPERDKTRGRIWRIRHKDQSPGTPIVLAKLNSSQLLDHLGAPNARISDLAWQEIVDRKATELVPQLRQLISQRTVPADKRLGALWALEGLQTAPTDLVRTLAADSNANIRHEAVRIAAAQPRSSEDFLSIAAPLVSDPEPKVRAALGDALRRVDYPSPQVIALMAQLGRPSISGEGDLWATYDREFERYLARWAMEVNAPAVATFLESSAAETLPLESRVLATLALDGGNAALGLTQLMPKLKRPLNDEEVRVLVSHCEQPAVITALEQTLSSVHSRKRILQSLLNLRTGLDTAKLHDTITRATSALWSDDVTASGRQFTLQIAGAFRVLELEKEIAVYASAPATDVDLKLAALRALREMGSSQVDILAEMVTNKKNGRPVRDEALAALAASKDKQASVALLGLLPTLDPIQRTTSLEQLAATKTGALALLDEILSGGIASDDVGISVLERMNTLLSGSPEMKIVWSRYASRLQHVLKLSGENNDSVGGPISLEGPFTVESWVYLAPDIGNEDGILGARDRLCLNFHEAHLRVWVGGGQGDIVVARRKTHPEVWTHYAVSRDVAGVVRIYINGELDATSQQQHSEAISGLMIGRTLPTTGGTEGSLAEYRIWNVARSGNQIRDNFDRSFAGESRPRGLVQYFAGKSWGQLKGKACVTPTVDAPMLLTAGQARAQREKFAKYRLLARETGDPEPGKQLFTSLCLPCHQQGGQGGQVAPPLDGIGLTGTEALLRNILTPNAAMEGGYRKFRIETEDDELLEGLLVSQDANAIILRQPNLADQRIPRSNVKSAAFTTTSVMPEGLLEALNEQQVKNLFTHLRGLK